MGKINQSIEELVGKTPLLQLNGYIKEKNLKANILAKLEFFNPNQSVKDRIALAMVEDAEKKGQLKPGSNSLPSEENPAPEEITGVHAFEGVPKERVPSTMDLNIYDEKIEVETEQVYKAARTAAKTDGVLIGTSSGAALYAAEQLALRPENQGKNIVVVFPDTGLRYLSTNLFE